MINIIISVLGSLAPTRCQNCASFELYKTNRKYSEYQIFQILFAHITNQITKIQNMKIISMLALLVSIASAYNYIPMKKAIPTKYCIVKNCHNCARSFNHNFGTRASRAVCTAMYHQAGCCDFYIKRSKGILF